MALARRIVAELDVAGRLLDDLTALLAEYDHGGGVGTPAKNLIFAANGPKPELVHRDTVNNDPAGKVTWGLTIASTPVIGENQG